MAIWNARATSAKNSSDQDDVADEPELLGVDGEDEVAGALGDELEVGLRALHPALAERTAGADRDHRLERVEALAERVGRRIDQRQDALALVVVQQRPRHGQHGQSADRHHRQPAPRQAGEEDHEEAGAEHQQRRAEVGLLDDQRRPARARCTAATTKSNARSPPSRLWKYQASIIGRPSFMISDGWMRADADVEPARGALDRDALQLGGDQQRHADDVDRHREPHQHLRRHVGGDEQHGERDRRSCAPGR